MIHNITRDIENLQGLFSREREPILTIDSGDKIRAQTRCCGWGLEPPSAFGTLPKTVKLGERKDPEHDTGICMVGPIAIRDALPGMTLEIEILELQVGAYGLTITGGDHKDRYYRMGLDDSFAYAMWQFDTKEGVAYTPAGHTASLRPFLGCMAIAANKPGYYPNLIAGQHGGNMDCKELVVGSKLYLPVAVPGALFSFGDGHAAQGDGEICDAAIECPMDSVRLKLTLREDMPIQWPIANAPSGWITFGFHENLNEAIFMAINNILDLIIERIGVTRKEAAILASTAVDLRISQLVNPTVGAYAVLPHGSLSIRRS